MSNMASACIGTAQLLKSSELNQRHSALVAANARMKLIRNARGRTRARQLPFFIPVAMIAINIVIVVRPVGVEAVDTSATLTLALLPRRNLATRVMMFIAICARDSKARKGRRGIGRLYEGAEGRNSRGTHGHSLH